MLVTVAPEKPATNLVCLLHPLVQFQWALEILIFAKERAA